jgi:hypothetical protein
MIGQACPIAFAHALTVCVGRQRHEDSFRQPTKSLYYLEHVSRKFSLSLSLQHAQSDKNSERSLCNQCPVFVNDYE